MKICSPFFSVCKEILTIHIKSSFQNCYVAVLINWINVEHLKLFRIWCSLVTNISYFFHFNILLVWDINKSYILVIDSFLHSRHWGCYLSWEFIDGIPLSNKKMLCLEWFCIFWGMLDCIWHCNLISAKINENVRFCNFMVVAILELLHLWV